MTQYKRELQYLLQKKSYNLELVIHIAIVGVISPQNNFKYTP